MGVAKDNYKHDGTTRSFVAAFAEVEVDVETGMYTITDFLAVADVGTVIHPAALGGQMLGRSMLGHRSRDRSAVGVRPALRRGAREAVLQQQARRRFSTRRENMAWDAVGLPDPETPVGARGIGEPPVAAGCCSVLNAISDALGDDGIRSLAGSAGSHRHRRSTPRSWARSR